MLIVVYEEESNWVLGLLLLLLPAMVLLLPSWFQQWLKTHHSATIAYIFKIQDTWLPDQTSYVSLLHDYDHYKNEFCCCLSLLRNVVIMCFSLCVLKRL